MRVQRQCARKPCFDGPSLTHVTACLSSHLVMNLVKAYRNVNVVSLVGVDLVVCAVIGWGSKMPGAYLGHSVIVFEWMAACQVCNGYISLQNFLWFLGKMTQVLLPSPLRFGRRNSYQSKVSFWTKILSFSSCKKPRKWRDKSSKVQVSSEERWREPSRPLTTQRRAILITMLRHILKQKVTYKVSVQNAIENTVFVPNGRSWRNVEHSKRWLGFKCRSPLCFGTPTGTLTCADTCECGGPRMHLWAPIIQDTMINCWANVDVDKC